MASLSLRTYTKVPVESGDCLMKGLGPKRWASTQARKSPATLTGFALPINPQQEKTVNWAAKTLIDPAPLSRLSTKALLRSILLGQIFTRPLLMKPGMVVLQRIIKSKSLLLDPDQNPILRAALRGIVYDHFCAGVNTAEVTKTIAEMKRMGYAGVILDYAKELVIDESTPQDSTALKAEDNLMHTQVQAWLDGNIRTLSMIGDGDYTGIKFTGAGEAVAEALAAGKEPPAALAEAMDQICLTAKSQGSRIWIDAEQQAFQPTIDRWTIDLMRRHNREGHVVVLNTIQAYLKSSHQNVLAHLRLAKDEGWTLGLKLVRGAYIGSDPRDRIHDTKADTDASYNGIIRDILTKSFPGFNKENFPEVRLMLACHNAESIQQASELYRNLTLSGERLGSLEFGQLQGMADDVSCELLQLGAKARDCDGLSEQQAQLQRQTAPRVFKCLTWGTVQECLHFLMRRAVENQGAADRLKSGLAGLQAELKRRVFGR